MASSGEHVVAPCAWVTFRSEEATASISASSRWPAKWRSTAARNDGVASRSRSRPFGVITAHVPQSELFSYATELKSLTGGRGTFTSTLDRYDDVPAHIAEKVVADHKKDAPEPAGH